MKDLARRLPTTMVLIVFAYAVIRFLPALPFLGLLYLIIAGAAVELWRLTGPQNRGLPLVLLNGLVLGASFVVTAVPLELAFFFVLFSTGLYLLFMIRDRDLLFGFVRDFGIHLLAAGYLFFPLFFLFRLKQLGPNHLFFLILVIAVGDSGAYFVGSAIGRHKIYPVASPRKSLEGLIAAVITAGLSGWLSVLLFPIPVPVRMAVVTGAVIGLVSQLSDPVESLFKRAAGQKDSGTLLPGHGGLLDRLDSYIFCAPLLYFMVTYWWK
jgi:phosphatidate cytidylyltransferase